MRFLIILTSLLVLFVPSFAQKLKPEEVIAKHLNSIATAENLSQIKTMTVVGDASVIHRSQSSAASQGRVVLASAGEKNLFGMNLNAIDYPTERFSFDGKKVKVAFVRPGARSILGNLILSNGAMLQESLFGGVLSTSWALLNLESNKAKVFFEGTKKIDGKETYVLSYTAKGTNDFNVKLFFDKETFRHLRTEYQRVLSAGVGTAPDQSRLFSENRLSITEDFSDFKTEKNLTLPHSYKLNYSMTGQSVITQIEWKFNFTQFAFNQEYENKVFDIEAN
jgi:hypothetical protein